MGSTTILGTLILEADLGGKAEVKYVKVKQTHSGRTEMKVKITDTCGNLLKADGWVHVKYNSPRGGVWSDTIYLNSSEEIYYLKTNYKYTPKGGNVEIVYNLKCRSTISDYYMP